LPLSANQSRPTQSPCARALERAGPRLEHGITVSAGLFFAYGAFDLTQPKLPAVAFAADAGRLDRSCNEADKPYRDGLDRRPQNGKCRGTAPPGPEKKRGRWISQNPL